METKLQKGFVVVGLAASAFAMFGMIASVTLLALNSARAKSRDAKRLADVKQLSAALELYNNDTSHYPVTNGQIIMNNVTGLTPTYIGVIPTYPLPADGNCGSHYLYEGSSNFYTLTFCLGAPTGGYRAGTQTLTPLGIQ